MEINIKSQLKSGLLYSALAKYSGIVISLIVSAVLARLLTPEDFGIIAISMVFIVFISLLSDLGFGPGIIQNKNLLVEDTNNLFSVTIWLAISFSIIFYFCSPLIADYYHAKSLNTVCKILTVNVFFSTANIVPNALLNKAKLFKFIAYRTLVIQVLAGIISIIAALYGAGIYSLLINPISYSFTMFIIDSNKSKVKFKFKIDFRSVRKIFSFSMYQFFFNFINYFTRNADTLLIGRFLGMNPLGFYDKSYRLMMLPIANITNVLTPVIHPIFSDLQNDKKRMYYANKKIIKFLAYIGFPFSVLLYFLSKEIILIVYGNQWEKAIPVFRILSLSACLQIVGCSSGAFFQSLNATKNLFLCGIINAFILISFILAGVFYLKTIEGVALSFSVSSVIGFFSTFYFLIKKSFGENLRPFLKVFVSPFIFSVFLFVFLYFINLYINSFNLFTTTFIKVSVGAIAFYIYLRYIEKLNMRELYKTGFKN